MLDVDLLLAEKNVDRLPEASGSGHVERTLSRELLAQERFEFSGVARNHVLRAGEIVPQVGRQLGGRRRRIDRELIERGRGSPIARLRVVVRLEDQRAQVARIERQRLLRGGERRGLVVEA